MLRSTLAFLAVLLLSAMISQAGESCCPGPLVAEDDFEQGADRWQPTDANAWRVVQSDRGKVYNQFQKSKYNPPHRSPHNVSLLKDVVVSDFVLEVDVQSTHTTAGAHQDMCLFFNYQDPAHFYYVHLGKRPDPHSSQIMVVDGAARKMITNNTSPGIAWTDGWHHVKIIRRTEDGTIEIYFDDMDKPVMTANDKTFTHGRVGLGSFDDHGNWDNFKLSGKTIEK